MLDIRTLIIVLGFVFLASAVMLFFAHKENKDMKGPEFWAAGNAVIALGLALLFARGHISDLVSIVLANLLIQGGAALLFIGIQRFLGTRRHDYLVAGVTFLFWLPYWFFYDVPEALDIRIHTSNAALSVFFLASAFLLLNNFRGKKTNPQFLTGATFTAFGITCFIRSLVLEMEPYQQTDYMSFAVSNALFYLIFITTHLLLSLGLLMMIAGRLRLNLVHSLKREKEARTEQSNFWAMVSHEFKTPMSTIEYSAELINELEKNLQEPSEKALVRISRATTRLSRLVDQSLASEWIDAAATELKKTEIDIKELLRDLSFEYRFPLKDQTPSGPVLVAGDPHLLSTAISTLIDNAQKYGSNPEACYLCLHHTNEGELAIDVFNEGNPLSDEEKELIFKKFYRLERHRGQAGSGFGLYITAKILKLHGFEIEVLHDEGTIFRIRAQAL